MKTLGKIVFFAFIIGTIYNGAVDLDIDVDESVKYGGNFVRGVWELVFPPQSEAPTPE